MIEDLAPGIFAGRDRRGVILHSDTLRLVTPAAPARPGEKVTVLCTGLGPGAQSAPSGAPPALPVRITASVQLSVAGTPAEVVAAELSTEYPGLYQVIARLAESTPSNERAPVVLTSVQQ